MWCCGGCKSVIELYEARRQLSQTVVSQQQRLLEQAGQIIQLNMGMVEALATAIEFRSEESGGHVRRIHDITKCMLSQTQLGAGLKPGEPEEIAHALSQSPRRGQDRRARRHPQQARPPNAGGVCHHERAHRPGRGAAGPDPPAAPARLPTATRWTSPGTTTSGGTAGAIPTG